MLVPGPGKMFIIPDERHKIRASGLAIPTIAQDDADHGTVVAMGAPAWLGEIPGDVGLRYNDGSAGWQPVRQEAPCAVGDVVAYDCTKVVVTPLGWSDKDGKVYILDQREVLAIVEVSGGEQD